MNPEPVAVTTGFATFRARVMFLLGFAYLLLGAALIHRMSSTGVTETERSFVAAGLLALWPIFGIEAFVGACSARSLATACSDALASLHRLSDAAVADGVA